MPVITVLTALNIYTQPQDLEFIIGEETGAPRFKFGYCIFRKNGANLKPLITIPAFAENLEGALGAVEVALGNIRDGAIQALKNPDSIPSEYLRPRGQPLDQSKVLDKRLIDRILQELSQHRRASTCEMLVAA